jgi:D-sedoheptulose 7-phosphate isomerase
MDITNLKKEYITSVIGLLRSIKDSEVQKLLNEIIEVRKSNRKILVVGNGGSALNAIHFSMGISIVSKKWKNPIKAIALSESSLITSIANDYGFEHVYSKLLEVYAEENDLLICLSTSGNSVNVINAVIEAKNRNIRTFALLGSDGGSLLSLVDNYILIECENKDSGQAEDIHMIIGHFLTSILEHHDG